MADTHSPDSDTPSTPAPDVWPGIGRIEIPRPDFLDDEPVTLVEDEDDDPIGRALSDAEDCRLHLGAVLEILCKCHPAYPIEAGLYVGNLRPIYARINRLIESLCLVVDAQVSGVAA